MARGFDEVLTYEDGVRVATQGLSWQTTSLNSDLDDRLDHELTASGPYAETTPPPTGQSSAANSWITLDSPPQTPGFPATDLLADLLGASDDHHRRALDLCFAADEEER